MKRATKADILRRIEVNIECEIKSWRRSASLLMQKRHIGIYEDDCAECVNVIRQCMWIRDGQWPEDA